MTSLTRVADGFEWRVQYGIYSESGWCETEAQALRVAGWAYRAMVEAVHPRSLWSISP